MIPPLRFCFGLHLHQPVGNFDSVFEQHLHDVYRPLLATFMDGGVAPVAMHVSGPLLEWLERHAPDFVDEIGRHASEQRLELLCAGHDEPILAVLSREDRLEQVVRHRDHLRARFGVEARGLWLTERVWEPSLPEELAQAGVHFVVVDDRHFRVTGFAPEQLHHHFVTESGGHRLAVFPIAEKLRYLVPFRPAHELAEYFRGLRAAGQTLCVLADDGEKFGGWPGTRKWLYEEGWMQQFVRTLHQLRESGEVILSRFDEALTATPSGGLAYLPSASYREMEGWSLPPDPARALLGLELDWGEARLAGVEGGLLRGGHWRHFLVKYPESNRMHKTMLALSALCRERGDPPAARRAIGRAQCNDAYWHGVFGGLYLPFLRGAIWSELALAESILRHGEALAVEGLDFDGDGQQEVWVHSARFSVLIAPSRGGVIEQFLDLEARANLVNVMTRHREAFHEPLARPDQVVAPHEAPGGAPSIHDIESHMKERPATDLEPRGLFVDRILAPGVALEDFVAGRIPVLHSWAGTRMSDSWSEGAEQVEVRATCDGLRKTITIGASGELRCSWEWDCAEDSPATGGWFSTELSFSGALEITAPGSQRWDYLIETVAKSEKGFDRTAQGSAVVLRWPLALGRASVMIAAIR